MTSIVLRSITGLLAVAGLLAACSPAPAPSGGPGPVAPTATPGATPGPSDLGATFDPSLGGPTVAFDGLYVSDQVSVAGDDTVAVVRSALQCSALEHLIGAGEWAITAREVETIGIGADAAPVMVLTLENGGETALAWLAGGDTCTARISRTTVTPLRISGAATFDGQAELDQPTCVTSGKAVTLAVSYRTPSGPNVAVSLSVPVRIGLARLDPDELTFRVARSPMSLPQLAASLLDSFRDSDTSMFPEAYVATDASRLTLDVRSLNPLSGTLHLADLDGDRGTMSLDAEVACHLPGGALDRAAAAAAGPAPTATPATGATPGPTLAPIAGVEPGTIVATGGAVAGTYRVAASGLDCYFDVDAGAWTIETLGDADATFFLYAFMGQGGGSTGRASMGLIVGDGSNGRIALFDTSISPPVGSVQVGVTLAGSQLTIVAQGRNPNGVTLTANLACQAS